jgi:hypothetical protein
VPRLHNMRLLALILIVAVSTVASAQSARRCVAGRDTVEASAHAPLRAGRYRLEIVATRGSRSGRRSVGALELRAAHAADRSRAHPAERAPADTSSAPLVGSTDVNLRAVGAPLAASSDGEYRRQDRATRCTRVSSCTSNGPQPAKPHHRRCYSSALCRTGEWTMACWVWTALASISPSSVNAATRPGVAGVPLDVSSMGVATSA